LIGIKYCGGCNPQINRFGLVQEIEKLLPPDCIKEKSLSRSLRGYSG
jgi:hypothetical protein